jgi:hypothetical protein
MFVAPVGFMVYNQANKEKKRIKKLAFLAGQAGFSLNETENIGDLSLAIDNSSKMFIILHSGKKANLQVIELSGIKKVELLRSDEDGKSMATLDDIREISLLIQNKESADKRLKFYAEEDDPVTQKSDRLEQAQKWQKILQQHSML